MRAAATRRRGLFLKYVVLFVTLVGGALVTSGVIETSFSYQEHKAALSRLQREKALAAASRIEQFVKEIERQMAWTTQPMLGAPAQAREQRRVDYLRLLRQVPAITEISHLDPAGREQLKISRLAIDVVGSQADFSLDPRFLAARAGKAYFSPVYFRKESEPYMTIAMASGGSEPAVTVAEVNLKFIWDVVSQINIGRAGHAYVVDSQGRLIAHRDISLVLKKTDLSAFPYVQAARAAGPVAEPDQVTVARDLHQRQVLTAHAAIVPLGWLVFVDLPVSEAFAPLYDSIVRAAILLVIGLGLSLVASLLLARRMVTPIRALQEGAARIGAGALDQRIAVRTGDELEQLGEQFNRMAAQLQESYAGLERKVEERTRDLRETLEQQTATAEILRVISSSPRELRPVFDAILENATRLCDANIAAVFLYDGEALTAVAHRNASPEFAARLERERPRPSRQTATRLAALERQVVHVTDFLSDPRFERPDTPAYAVENPRSILAVPMMRGANLVGVVTTWRREVRPFSDTQVELLRTFADQAVIAIENVRLFTEIEEKSRQLEVANRHKSEFLANMSHELRTPLNAIIGFSEVLIERMFGDVNEKQEEYLRDIYTSGRHLLSLINDILDLSKVEAGRMELELTRFNLPMAVDNALTLVRHRAENHAIALEATVDERLGDFVGDERKFKQILLNLLSNAVKFTPEGGRVGVRAALADGSVEIAVSDTGLGIPAADQDLIFEEFRQSGTEHAGKREGTGLGLTLTRKFIELHGGRIWVKSEVGKGSTFTFTLPLRASHDSK